jgi:biotin operon repressor
MSKARPPGFIQIHRTMLDWEWYQDDRCVRMLLHLLLKANHTEAKWKGISISPGDVITSTVSLADQLGWSRSAVNRTLEKLKACGEVDTKSDNKRTLVSLVKWAKYQGEWSKSDIKPDSKRTSIGQQTGQPADTVKEGEEFKKEKNTPIGVKARTIADRKAQFVAACKSVIETDPERLVKSERKAFVDYWTEPTHDGQHMRFEAEKFFDHGRRMDTWRNRNAEKTQALNEPKSTEKSWVR